MSGVQGAEKDILIARLEDALSKVERGSVAVLPFLTPRDCRRVERELRHRGLWSMSWLWGGYPSAERACLFLLPDFFLPALPDSAPNCSAEDMRAVLEEEIEESVSAVRITGSGFCKLSHRDFLGAVLGLGLERDALGDLAMQNEQEAVLFCPAKLVPFLTTNLVKVRTDSVRCVPYVPDDSFWDGRKYQPVSDTVASERLDCVIAALCNLSRESAQIAVRSGIVEVDYEPVERVDFLLSPPCTISVRGEGKFVLRSFDGETRKGRLRLRADRLI